MKHPSKEALRRVGMGLADVTEALIIEAHLHFCSQCREVVRAACDEIANPDPVARVAELPGDDDILAAINASIDKDSSVVKAPPSTEQTGFLPGNILQEIGSPDAWKWQSFWPSKGRVALIASDAGSPYELYLGCIAPGASMPGHAHTHLEQTLILKGSYITAGGEKLVPGGWDEMTPGDIHHPTAGAEEECYCLIRSYKKGYRFVNGARWRNSLLWMV